MDVKDFGKYVEKKSLSRLLHRARKESLDRILGHQEPRRTLRKKPAQKRTGTR